MNPHWETLCSRVEAFSEDASPLMNGDPIFDVPVKRDEVYESLFSPTASPESNDLTITVVFLVPPNSCNLVPPNSQNLVPHVLLLANLKRKKGNVKNPQKCPQKCPFPTLLILNLKWVNSML